MELTGQCKKDFEKWYRNPLGTDEPRWTNWSGGFDLYSMDSFNRLDFSMQYGVFVDFFDSVEIDITIKLCGYLKYDYSIKDKESHSLLFTEYDWSQTRTEARQKAIEKANEIYNSRI